MDVGREPFPSPGWTHIPGNAAAVLWLWVPKGLGEQGGIPQSWHCQPGGFFRRCSRQGWIPPLGRSGMDLSGSHPSEGWGMIPSIPCCPSAFPGSLGSSSRRKARLRTLHCAGWGLSPFASLVWMTKCVTAVPRPRRGLGWHRAQRGSGRGVGGRMGPPGTRWRVMVAEGTRSGWSFTPALLHGRWIHP